jgi:hypothetical protein
MSAVNNGPQIFKSGLIFCLDAGNNKSYSSNRFQSYGSGLVTEDVTFSINGTGTFKRVATGTVIGGYKIKPNDVVYSYVLGTNGCHYHGNQVAIPTGVYATFSFDYLVTGATNYPSTDYLANFENYGGGALGGAVATLNNKQDLWQRVSFTSGPTTSAGTQAMFLYPGLCPSNRLADSGTIYFRNPKVEFRSSDSGTSGYSSSKSVLTWYDISGNNYNGTFGLTTGPTFDYAGGGSLLFDGSTQYVTTSTIGLSFTSFSMECLVKYNSLSGNQGLFTYNGSNVINLWKGSGAGMRWEVNNTSQSIVGTNDLVTGAWYHFVGVYDGAKATLYRNGIVNAGPTTLTSHTSESAVFEIGRYNGAGYTNGNIALARFYNRALSGAEVIQNYEATKTRFGL